VSSGILILAPLAEVLFIGAYYDPELRSKQEEREQTLRSYRERGIVVNEQPPKSLNSIRWFRQLSGFLAWPTVLCCWW